MQKRLHIHMSVDNIEQSIAFYSVQFNAEPTKVKDDYAQWLVDDLALNFAISTRGEKKGVNHLGVQYESDEALLSAQTLFEEKGIKGKEDKGAVCCYKESNKYWVEDPTGMVWENYHSVGDIEVFGVDSGETSDGCCVPTFGSFSETPQSTDACCTQPEDGSTCC
ncbi:MAG TPA: glyoxalase/bleomycin resistance/dioxygenase family protein [Sulfurovum sp.]|nr:glyoxalase/bleomycin resistance/dioxygenase family protein [Sulfurovum sp.]